MTSVSPEDMNNEKKNKTGIPQTWQLSQDSANNNEGGSPMQSRSEAISPTQPFISTSHNNTAARSCVYNLAVFSAKVASCPVLSPVCHLTTKGQGTREYQGKNTGHLHRKFCEYKGDESWLKELRLGEVNLSDDMMDICDEESVDNTEWNMSVNDRIGYRTTTWADSTFHRHGTMKKPFGKDFQMPCPVYPSDITANKIPPLDIHSAKYVRHKQAKDLKREPLKHIGKGLHQALRFSQGFGSALAGMGNQKKEQHMLNNLSGTDSESRHQQPASSNADKTIVYKFLKHTSKQKIKHDVNLNDSKDHLMVFENVSAQTSKLSLSQYQKSTDISLNLTLPHYISSKPKSASGLLRRKSYSVNNLAILSECQHKDDDVHLIRFKSRSVEELGLKNQSCEPSENWKRPWGAFSMTQDDVHGCLKSDCVEQIPNEYSFEHLQPEPKVSEPVIHISCNTSDFDATSQLNDCKETNNNADTSEDDTEARSNSYKQFTLNLPLHEGVKAKSSLGSCSVSSVKSFLTNDSAIDLPGHLSDYSDIDRPEDQDFALENRMHHQILPLTKPPNLKLTGDLLTVNQDSQGSDDSALLDCSPIYSDMPKSFHEAAFTKTEITEKYLSSETIHPISDFSVEDARQETSHHQLRKKFHNAQTPSFTILHDGSSPPAVVISDFSFSVHEVDEKGHGIKSETSLSQGGDKECPTQGELTGKNINCIMFAGAISK